MNWAAMLAMAGTLGAVTGFALIAVWLITERDVHPAWVMGAMFLAATIATGLTVPHTHRARLPAHPLTQGVDSVMKV